MTGTARFSVVFCCGGVQIWLVCVSNLLYLDFKSPLSRALYAPPSLRLLLTSSVSKGYSKVATSATEVYSLQF